MTFAAPEGSAGNFTAEGAFWSGHMERQNEYVALQ
jgi:hypothetical protein